MTSTLGIKKIQYPNGTNIATLDSSGSIAFAGASTVAGTLGVTGIGTFTDDIIIGDGKTIGSASKTDAITIASSGLVQLRSTGIGAGSQILQVIDDGATLFQIRAEDGNISFPQAGAGIYLGVTSGTAANLLDDYEEGTFSPVFQTGGNSNGISHSISSGTYTKVGNRVICNGFAAMNGKDGASLTGGNVTIGGLPFAVSNDNNSYSAAGIRPQNISFADFMSLATIVGGTQLDFREITNSGSVTTLTDGNIASNSYIIFDISYRTG